MTAKTSTRTAASTPTKDLEAQVAETANEFNTVTKRLLKQAEESQQLLAANTETLGGVAETLVDTNKVVRKMAYNVDSIGTMAMQMHNNVERLQLQVELREAQAACGFRQTAEIIEGKVVTRPLAWGETATKAATVAAPYVVAGAVVTTGAFVGSAAHSMWSERQAAKAALEASNDDY